MCALHRYATLPLYSTSVNHNNPEGETYYPHFTNMESEVWEEYNDLSFAQGHPAGKEQRQDLNTGLTVQGAHS